MVKSLNMSSKFKAMNPQIYKAALYAIFLIPLCALTIAVGLYELSHPFLNWDLLPYAGLVEKLRHANSSEIHDNAYLDVFSYAKAHSSILADNWNQLITGQYRVDNLKSTDVFLAQLPFYSCKPFYIILLSWVSHLTASITRAAIYISVASVFISTLFMVIFSHIKKIPLFISLIIGLLFFLNPIIFETARFQTPDALALAFITSATIFFLLGLEKCAAIIFLAAILVRPDIELLCFIMAVFMVFSNLFENTKFSKTAIVILFFSVVLKSFIYHYYGAYGYLTLIKFSLITGQTDFPNLLNVSNIGIFDFLKIYKNTLTIPYFYMSHTYLIFLSLAGLAIYFIIGKNPPQFGKSEILYISLVAYTVAHILLFPLLDARYFAPVLSMAFLIMLDKISIHYANRASDPAQNHKG